MITNVLIITYKLFITMDAKYTYCQELLQVDLPKTWLWFLDVCMLLPPPSPIMSHFIALFAVLFHSSMEPSNAGGTVK